jgi:short subunit dehydrogenase-like uncharacterized protein
MGKLMIYGGTGYTGSLMCDQANQTGLKFVLAGRTQSSVRSAANKLDVSY